MIRYQVLTSVEAKDIYRERFSHLFEMVFNRQLGGAEWSHLVTDAPYGTGRLIVAIDGDRLVGTANLIPQKLGWGTLEWDYFLLTTSMVDPDYRKEGVYAETINLVKQVADDIGGKFILAFPNPKALPLLTRFFGFKSIMSVPLVTMRDSDELKTLKADVSIKLDLPFWAWRLSHRDYFIVRQENQVLICKEYQGVIDILEVLDTGAGQVLPRLPERTVNLVNAICPANRLKSEAGTRTLTTLNATYLPLKAGVDLAGIDISLLMWDVI